MQKDFKHLGLAMIFSLLGVSIGAVSNAVELLSDNEYPFEHNEHVLFVDEKKSYISPFRQLRKRKRIFLSTRRIISCFELVRETS